MSSLDTCPNCGSHVLFEVSLDYGGDAGFRADVYGITPELGDTILSCGDCASFVVLDSDDEEPRAGFVELVGTAGGTTTTTSAGTTTTVSIGSTEGGQ